MSLWAAEEYSVEIQASVCVSDIWLLLFLLLGNIDARDSLIFTASASLGRFSHRVAMSVCLCVCLSAPLGAVFF